MSFLDNLENNLKALESREQGGLDERAQREAERDRARAAAPWAERLKNAPWTSDVMQKVTRAGHQRRIKVHLLWIGTTLRLEALGQRLELQPQPDGIAAVFRDSDGEMDRQVADLNGEPDALIARWMTILDEQKKKHAEETRRALEEESAAELAEAGEASGGLKEAPEA